MSRDIELDHAGLTEAISQFQQAATQCETSELRHTQTFFASLTGIDETVRQFFYALWVGRTALADAARNAAATVAKLASETEQLDNLAAARLSGQQTPTDE